MKDSLRRWGSGVWMMPAHDALTVLSVLICVFGLLAGASNAAAITFIAFTPKLRKLTFGKLLLNLAVSGS